MEGAIVFMAILWFGIAFLVAEMGRSREVGYTAVLLISLLLSPIIGFIVALVSAKIPNALSGSSSKSVGENRFKISLDEAKKAAFKGETEKAISLYQDTLYYMSNDYDNLNNKVEQNRQALMNDIKGRIEELKQKL
jgi:hypothetical protein